MIEVLLGELSTETLEKMHQELIDKHRKQLGALIDIEDEEKHLQARDDVKQLFKLVELVSNEWNARVNGR